MIEYVDVLNKNGEYTNQVVSREECHKNGLYHKIVVIFILSNDNKEILLQKRSESLEFLPDLWDISAGGHVKAGEINYDAAIRETYEEIGLNLKKEDLEYIGTGSCETVDMGNHFVDYFIVHREVDILNLHFDKSEIQDLKWFDVDELISRIEDNYQGLTSSYWAQLIKYLKKGEF